MAPSLDLPSCRLGAYMCCYCYKTSKFVWKTMKAWLTIVLFMMMSLKQENKEILGFQEMANLR